MTLTVEVTFNVEVIFNIAVLWDDAEGNSLRRSIRAVTSVDDQKIFPLVQKCQ